MKKILVILLCVSAVATVSCRNKEAERRRQEMERIRQEQESAKLADEQKLIELQMRAKRDSLAMALAKGRSNSEFSGYYVVIGSFRVANNARNYLYAQKGNFNKVDILKRRGWNYVIVGGRYNSFAGAARACAGVAGASSGVKETAEGGDEDEDEYSDDEDEDDGGGDDEDYGEDEEDYEDEEEDDGGGFQASGQAWVMRL